MSPNYPLLIEIETIGSDEVYNDDATISNNALLWRRIPPTWWVRDENLGRIRPTSQAFDDSRDGTPMSVLLAEIVARSGRSPIDVLVGHGGFALAAVTSGLARDCNQGIARDPQPQETAHAVVFGQKTGAVKSRLAKNSTWVIPPAGV